MKFQTKTRDVAAAEHLANLRSGDELTLLVIFRSSVLLVVKLGAHLIQQLCQAAAWCRNHATMRIIHDRQI